MNDIIPPSFPFVFLPSPFSSTSPLPHLPLTNNHYLDILGGVADTIGSTTKAVTDTVGDTVGAVGKGVGDGIGALGTGLGNTVTGATSGIGDTTKAVGDTAKSGTDSIGGKKQDAQNPLGL